MDETEGKLTSGEPLSVEQLVEYLPALKEIPGAQLQKYAQGAAVLQRYRQGQTVCVEGSFGSTAYYIVSGTVEISIQNPMAHLRTRPTAGLFGRSMARMKSVLMNDGQDKRAEAHERKFISPSSVTDV